jgi:hypothetical protein
MHVVDTTGGDVRHISRFDAISRCSPSESTVSASTPYPRRHLGMMKAIKGRRAHLGRGPRRFEAHIVVRLTFVSVQDETVVAAHDDVANRALVASIVRGRTSSFVSKDFLF